MSFPNDQKNQKMLTLIFVETELETIPLSIQQHSQVKAYAEKRRRPAAHLILDATYHYHSMRKLPDWKRRGRPDIIHRCLLLALDSWANHQGLLDIYIHTRNDEIIHVDPLVRLPKHYHRFLGLFEQLFEQKTISSESTTFLSIEKQTLDSFVKTFSQPSFLLSEQGKPCRLIDFFHEKIHSHCIIGIGAFPHGDFQKANRYFDECLSVGSISYSASTVTAKALFSFEESFEHKTDV